MARNDVVLLDSLFDKTKLQFGNCLNDSSYFELFCFDQLLKNYDLSFDELLGGQVDGGDDGGIDGYFTFLNDTLLREVVDEKSIARNPVMTVHILSVKHGNSFRQTPLNSLLSSLPDIFDLQRDEDDIQGMYNEELLTQRRIFRESYINLATSHPKLELVITYASRGDTRDIPPNVHGRAIELRNRLTDMFSDVDLQVRFYGASELLQLARRRRSYSLRLRFIENYVSRGRSNYVLLSRLDDYYSFITDEEGTLRRYLFESNVRDYLGFGSVNREIMQTLESRSNGEDIDFWWLNNGITILSSSATVAGKELSLENVQIVNGLQTTETLYRYLSQHASVDDNRALLIKVIVTDSDEARDRIIRATNYQTSVETASLRATDKVQRDIEHLLADYGWFYDRRKNYHKNQGRSSDRIISMSYLGAAVQALVLRRPALAEEQRTRYMRQDKEYREVFSDSWDLHVFLVCLELVKHFDSRLRAMEVIPSLNIIGKLHNLKFLASLIFVCASLESTDYDADQLASLKGRLPTVAEVEAVIMRLDQLLKENTAHIRDNQGRGWSVHGLARSEALSAWLLTRPIIRQLL